MAGTSLKKSSTTACAGKGTNEHNNGGGDMRHKFTDRVDDLMSSSASPMQHRGQPQSAPMSTDGSSESVTEEKRPKKKNCCDWK
ncbi:hypothetical protein THAOC_28227, partial [Thalassiosira oceanica]